MIRSTSLALSILVIGGCGAESCIANHLVDGGIPSQEDVAFDNTMGDPGPLFDGGTTTYAGLNFETTFQGQQRTLTVSSGATTMETYVYANGDDSDITGTGDSNLDGTVDWQYRSTFDGVSIVSSTELTDTNFDGVFDSKDEWSVDISQGLPYQKTETLSLLQTPAGGGPATWVQQWTYTGPGAANDNGACNGYVGFPDQAVVKGNWVRVRQPATLIQILEDSSVSGGCTKDQTKKLTEGFKAALEDIADCTALVRPHLAVDVKVAVQRRTLYVACGNTCTDGAAATDLPYSPGPVQAILQGRQDGYQRMNVNPSNIFSHGALGTEETLIHELIHFAGFDHTPAGSNGDPVGHDMVYGCGRYCVRGGLLSGAKGQGCQHDSSGVATGGWPDLIPTAADYAFDCADCANEAHRVQCGAGLFEIPSCDIATCAGTVYGLCGSSCCQATALSCWANQATTLAGRDPELWPPSTDTCLASGCNSPDDPTCQVGNPVDRTTSKMACASYPVGWCLGP
jgi:hypothetical protein